MNKSISELDAITALNPGDVLLISQKTDKGFVSKKFEASAFKGESGLPAIEAFKAEQTQINANLQTSINSVSGGYIGAFATLAELNAKTGMTTGQVAKVMNDTTATNNGDYRYTGTAWVKGYDVLTDANNHADNKVGALITAQVTDLKNITALSSGYIDKTGAEASTTNWTRSDFLAVSTNDKITYNATANSTVSVIAAFDANKTYLRDLVPPSSSTLTVYNGTVTIPSDVKYIRVSCYTANSTTYTFGYTPYKIGVPTLDISNVSIAVYDELDGSTNLFNPLTASDNKYILNNVISDSVTWFLSDYIAVTPNEQYVTNGTAGGSTGTGVHYYDANKTYLSTGAKQTANTPFTVPSNAAFMRINYTKSTSQTIANTVVAKDKVIKTDYLKQKINNELQYYKPTTRYSSKTLMTMGDSITSSKSTAYTYPPKVANHFGMNLFDVAISGTRVRSSFADGKATDANIQASHIITIAHGTNDFKIVTNLGAITDTPTPKSTLDDAAYRDNNTTTGTFYADYRGVIEHILSVNPNARIMLITPIRRTAPANTGTDTNFMGFKLIDYVNAIKEIATFYGLPLLDNYNTSGFNTLTIPTWTTDGLHPTEWAQTNIMTQKVIGFINSN